MRAVFKDKELEAEFQKNGYVSLPFLTADEVNTLKTAFFELAEQSGGQITAGETGVENGRAITYDFTFIDKNPLYKQQVYDTIVAIFKPRFEHILQNYKPIIANYIRKQTDQGEVPLHQNWAFADEQVCSTISIWCPLVDSSTENGTLQVVPGSHKRFGELRGPMIPWELDAIKNEIIDAYLVPLPTQAGNCVILDDSIVHYSAVNKTNELRLAIQLICIPQELPSIHYHMNPAESTTHVNILEVDVDFYMHFNPWKQPDQFKKVGSRMFRSHMITTAEFEKKLKGPRFDGYGQNRMTRLWSTWFRK